MPKVKLWRSAEKEREDFRRRMVDAKRGMRGYKTQKALAEAMGMKEVGLCMRMTGKTKWDVEALLSMDQVLRFSEEELASFIRGGKRE